MRFVLPLALLAIVVAALIFISREPEIIPDISSGEVATVDQVGNTRGTKQAAQSDMQRLRERYGSSATRVCVSQPELVEVGGVELGQTIDGVAQFSIEQALNDYSQDNGRTVDTLRTVTLAVDTGGSHAAALEFDVAGVVKKNSNHSSSEVALRFPGHVLRNHSVATVVVRNAAGEMQGLTQYNDWMLCGEPYDDPHYEQRMPVANNVTDLTLGPGVNVMGGEYACAQGWGLQHHVAAGVTHEELANMLSVWGVKTVRLPVNEHCWLADHFAFQYLNGDTSGRSYQQSLWKLVQLLTDQYQMHVVLDLHWTGTTEEKALELKPLPNHEFSASFWRQVAEQFANNDRVVFNLFNEAHVPASNVVAEDHNYHNHNDRNTSSDSGAGDASLLADLSGDSTLEKQAMADNWWLIWRDGNDQYAGMQSLVDAIRSTGAANHISVGGLDYSADQRGWLTYAPHDPLGKLWVDNHAYPADNKCTERVCWEQTLLPLVASGYGVMFGEAGNSIGQYPQGCQTDFVKKVYRFARDHSIPVLAWTFIAGGVSDPQSNKPLDRNCQIPTLITRWPGELIDGDIGHNEVAEKNAFDPTPENLLDDATWPGCAFYAYANGLPLDDVHLPDIDPAETVPGRAFGVCDTR